MGKAHSNAYCQAGHFYDLPYRLRRTLLCGRDAASLARMADRWGWEETSTDWRAADRPPRHRRRRHRAAEPSACAGGDCRGRGRQDRPLREAAGAVGRRKAEPMVAAARGVPTLVWFNYRRVPAIAYARQLIDEGRLGQIFHYNAAYRQQWGADTSRAATWRMDPAQAGSGVADDLLTHLLDTALYLNGPITRGRRATRARFAPNRQIDDAVMALVRFENGSAGTFEATRFAIGCKNQNSFEIHGAGGHAAVQPRTAQSSRVRRRDRAVDRAGPARPAGDRPQASDLRQFLAARATSSATSTPSSRRWRSFSTASPATRTSIRASTTRSSRSRCSTRCCDRPGRGSGPTSRQADEPHARTVYDTSTTP